jgi:hypothetical protein
VGIECVPCGLRPIVVRQRARLATTRIKDLLQRIPKRTASRNPSGTLRACGQLLLKLNRLLGTLENQIVVAQSQNWWPRNGRNGTEKSMRSWLDAAQAARRGVQDSLACMASSAQTVARGAPQASKKQKLALARAEFYERLCTAESLDATALGHPFLEGAAKSHRARKKRHSKRDVEPDARLKERETPRET